VLTYDKGLKIFGAWHIVLLTCISAHVLQSSAHGQELENVMQAFHNMMQHPREGSKHHLNLAYFVTDMLQLRLGNGVLHIHAVWPRRLDACG
jgi:hypothetical protein